MSLDMVQSFSVEIDSTALLEQYLRLAMKTVLSAHDEISVAIPSGEEFKWPPPSFTDNKQRLPIIYVGGWFESEKDGALYPRDEQGNRVEIFRDVFRDGVCISAVDTAIAHILQLLEIRKYSWLPLFRKKFGEGFNASFNECDGDVETGYEIRNWRSFPERLCVSLVHIYYGK